MTNSEISKQVGRTETWLANIKLHRPKRYKYLLSFNKNKLQSIMKVINKLKEKECK
jgi:hypothetical protein